MLRKIHTYISPPLVGQDPTISQCQLCTSVHFILLYSAALHWIWFWLTGETGSERTETYAEQDVWLPVQQDHALAGNPKGLHLIGQIPSVRGHLKQVQTCNSLRDRNTVAAGDSCQGYTDNLLLWTHLCGITKAKQSTIRRNRNRPRQLVYSSNSLCLLKK